MRDRQGRPIYERADCWHGGEHEVWVERRHWRWVDSRWFGEGAAGTREGVAICQECPVRWECLTEALQVEAAGVEPNGTFGGFTAEERRALLALVREAG
jgi:hypothetical protein